MKKQISEIFNLSQIKKFMYSKEMNLKNEFISLLKEKKYSELSKIGIKLYDISPHYLFFSYLFVLRHDATVKRASKHRNLLPDKGIENIKKLLGILITKIDLNIHTLIYFLKNGMFLDTVVEEIKKCKIKDYLYYIVIKELLKVIGKGNDKILETNIDDILDNLDDWDVYEYCIEKNIELKPRDTINYKYYFLHMNKTPNNKVKEVIEDLLLSVKTYKDIEYIINTFEIENHTDDLVNDTILYIKRGYNQDIASKLYCKYISFTNEPRFITNLEMFGCVKLLLSHLIASKETNNLVLALFICYKNHVSSANSSDNYEINLIFMFLCRYFLFHAELSNLFWVMDIKNNQIFNLSFILNDVTVLKKITDKSRIESYATLFEEYTSVLLTNIPKFIEAKKISYAIDLIELYYKFKDNVLYLELIEGRIISKDPQNLFSYVLASHSSYIFDKLTKADLKRFKLHENDKNSAEKYFNTIDGGLHKYTPSLFNNDFHIINDDDFKRWFEHNLLL